MKSNTLVKRSSLILAFIGLSMGASQAAVSLVGEEITATGGGFTIPASPNTTTVVDPGVEYTGILSSVDVGASSVLFAVTAGSNQNIGGTQTITLSGLDFESTPGTTITGTTNLVISGVENFDITGFTADSVTFEYQGILEVGGTASFDLVTTTIPEPSSFALLGLALAGFVSRRRR